MDTIILVLGCSFVAGMVASMVTDEFFVGLAVGAFVGGQATTYYYLKHVSLGMGWTVDLLLPFMFVGTVLGAGIGSVFSTAPDWGGGYGD